MKLPYFIFSLLLPGILLAFESPDPTRSYLKRLGDNDRVTNDEYEAPFLIVETAQAYELEPDNVYAKLIANLRKNSLSFPGRLSKSGKPIVLTPSQIPLPKTATEGKQLDGIKACTVKYCAVKLITEEKKVLEKSEAKLETYHKQIADRLNRYLKDGKFVGYEERENNNETLQQAFSLLPFLKARYPKTAGFINDMLTKKSIIAPVIKGSFLRSEILNLDSDKMQPVLRFSEAAEYEENGSRGVIEPQIYTNHFFDSSMRIFEVWPLQIEKKKSVIIMTDVMEVDELKKSGFIRALFKGKMVSGIKQYQSNELSQIQ